MKRQQNRDPYKATNTSRERNERMALKARVKKLQKEIDRIFNIKTTSLFIEVRQDGMYQCMDKEFQSLDEVFEHFGDLPAFVAPEQFESVEAWENYVSQQQKEKGSCVKD